MQMEEPKNGPSIVEVTQCEDCGGMYDLCLEHGEYTFEGWDGPEIGIHRVPKGQEAYSRTDHVEKRMEERGVTYRDLDIAIDRGECKYAKGRNRFRFEYEDIVVIVQVRSKALGVATPKPPHKILTVYRNE